MITELYQHFLQSKGICTDTRKIWPGCIFFALRGPSFNANQFVEEALQRGARLGVVDDPAYATGDNTLLVEDGLQALQGLAIHHRQKLDIPVIGLTGSNGKTTTKELIKRVLSEKYAVFATQGNLNNHIGVPLSILNIDSSYDMAVIEMGANHVGEIARLSEIARPTHGLITNIGKAHIGTFGGYQNIIKGKTELYDFLAGQHSYVFINSRDEVLAPMAKRFAREKVIFFPDDFIKLKNLGARPFLAYQDENGHEITTQLIGDYNFPNVAVALCLGKFFDVPPGKVNQAVASYVPANNRSQIVKRGTNTIILDAYNANPSSMQAALENIKSYRHERKMVVLGDMNELGKDTELEHEKLGEQLSHMDVTQAFLCGKHIQAALHTFPEGHYFPNREELMAYFKQHHFKDTLILIKASRSLGLEVLIDCIE